MRIQIVNPNLSGDVSILDIGQTYLATFINQRTSHQAATMDFTFHRKRWQEHLRRNLEPGVFRVQITLAKAEAGPMAATVRSSASSAAATPGRR